ncbi:MAG: response regulator [Butyrivibrio sp.]|nr:response regulator [Acetatifactor muris]MCM1561151.1 response regulator [Butyrivibrio sp.]
MKKYYNILIGITMLTILSVFFILCQFKSEDDAAEEDVVYEMNAGWQRILMEPHGEGQASGGEVPWGEAPWDEAPWDSERAAIVVSLPYNGISEPGQPVIFENTIPPEYAGLTLVFYSTRSAVRVSLDNKVIYQYGVENRRMFGKSPGNRINFVDLPERIEEGRLRIELTSPYEDASASLGRVTVSQKDTVILQLIEDNLVNLSCCIIILICTVVFLILQFVCMRTGRNTYGILWLAALGIDTGLYYLVRTEILSVLYGAKAIFSMGQYLFIMLIPIFILLYLSKNIGKAYPKFFVVLFAAANLNVFVQLILQVCNIFDLADMVEATAILFRVVIVTGICLNVKEGITHRTTGSWITAAVSGILLLGELGEIFGLGNGTTFDAQGSTKSSRYAMTLFLFILAGYYIVHITRNQRKEAEENARKALAASEAKGKFLANMSHEIRTPINAVLGMDEMILRESKETKTREYAMDILTAGQTLLSLVNDILDLSKIESGKMELMPTNYDISSMIHDLSNMTEMRVEKKNMQARVETDLESACAYLQLHVEVDSELPCTLYGDDVRIRQVLTNILTNAVKYTQEGHIWLRVRLEKKEDRRATLYFEVEDTGIGIKEEDLPKLYAEFERIEENRNRNIEGTGLGMSITIQLLQMMGSRLQMESVYGKGSKFSFYLEQDIVEDKPVGDFKQNVQRLAAEYIYKTGFTAPDAEVLVVDDNGVNRKVFENLLRQTRVKITEADSGAKCLELTKQKHFDIIFLDHMMPEMDGVETLERLRKDTENPCSGVPVIALTANAVSGAREQYLECGFNDYLSKPIVSEKLERMLCSYLPEDLIREAEEEDGEPAESAAGKPDLEQLPAVEGLDWNYAWLHLPEMSLLQTTVEAFYEQIPMAGEKLAACYQAVSGDGEFSQYRIQVHAMKSLAATVGILPLAGMAKVLEDAAGKEQPEAIHSMHGIFMTEWNSYREKLAGVFGIKAPEEKAEMEDSSIICALLDMLRLAMQDMDIDDADERMKQIYTYRYPEEVQRNVELLKAAVENLDPEQTEAYVQTLIKQLSGQKESV